FFFSSRRRHTRSKRDWSSDVCSSDLDKGRWPPDEQRWPLFVPTELRGAVLAVIGYGSIGRELARMATTALGMRVLACKRDPSRRSEERRVGKERRARGCARRRRRIRV